MFREAIQLFLVPFNYKKVELPAHIQQISAIVRRLHELKLMFFLTATIHTYICRKQIVNHESLISKQNNGKLYSRENLLIQIKTILFNFGGRKELKRKNFA